MDDQDLPGRDQEKGRLEQINAFLSCSIDRYTLETGLLKKVILKWSSLPVFKGSHAAFKPKLTELFELSNPGRVPSPNSDRGGSSLAPTKDLPGEAAGLPSQMSHRRMSSVIDVIRIDPGLAFADLPADESVAAHFVEQMILKRVSIGGLKKYMEKKGVRIAEEIIREMLLRANLLLIGWYQDSLATASGEAALACSDTSIPVFDNEKGRGRPMGYYRVYAHEASRTFLFTYQRGRKRLPPDWTITGFNGFMQAEEWGPSPSIEETTGIRRVGSLGHMRKSFEALSHSGVAGLDNVLSHLHILRSIEDECSSRGLSHEERRTVRAERSTPVLVALRASLEAMQSSSNPDPRLQRLLNDTLQSWQTYTLYANRGDIEADHRMTDHGIPLFGNAPNPFLSAPTDDVAYRMAILYSTMATILYRGQDPFNGLCAMFNGTST